MHSGKGGINSKSYSQQCDENEDDQLAELLNGLGFRNGVAEEENRILDDEVFYINGEPTDRFLEALKSDKALYNASAGQQLNNSGSSHSRLKTSSKYHPNYSDYFTDSIPPSLVQQESEWKVNQSDLEAHNGNHSSSRAAKGMQSKRYIESDLVKESFSSLQQQHPNSSQGGLVRQTREPIADLTKEDIALETKLKSLELRIGGQLKTIRSLESQIAELNSAIKEKDQQIIALSCKVKNLSSNSTQQVANDYRSSSKSASAKSDKLQAHVEFLEVRLGEEQSRRQRAEERCRSLKEYLEQTKSKCSDFEKKDLETQKHCLELQQKLLKYRKDCKELVGTFGAQRALVVEKEAENNELRQRVAVAEQYRKQLETDLHAARDELRLYHSQAISFNSKFKNAELELQLLREREAAWKAERQVWRLAGSAPKAETSSPSRARPVRSRSESPTNRKRQEAIPRQGHAQVHVGKSIPVSATTTESVSAMEFLDEMIVRQSREFDEEVVAENINYLANSKEVYKTADYVPTTAPYWRGAGVVNPERLERQRSVHTANNDANVEPSEFVSKSLEPNEAIHSSHHHEQPARAVDGVNPPGEKSFLGFLERSKSLSQHRDEGSDSYERNYSKDGKLHGKQASAKWNHTPSIKDPPSQSVAPQPSGSRRGGKLRFDRLQHMYSRVVGRRQSSSRQGDSTESDSDSR